MRKVYLKLLIGYMKILRTLIMILFVLTLVAMQILFVCMMKHKVITRNYRYIACYLIQPEKNI